MYFCIVKVTNLYAMKKYGFVLLPVILVLSGALSSCRSDEVPEDVMSEERMASFLHEAYMIEGFYAVESGFHYDTLQPEMLGAYDTLLAHYGLSRDEFEHSVDWYTSHPKVYQQVHDTVLARFDREAADLGAE